MVAALAPLAHPSAAQAAGNPTYRYTKTFDTTNGGAGGDDVATDSNGNVYIAGFFSGTVIFDGVGGSDSRTDTGGNGDSFVTKYSSNGSYAWTRTFDATAGSATDNGITTDSSGNIYVVGTFTGTVIFDGVGGSDTQTDAGGSQDSYLTKYNSNGSYGWTKTFDTTGGYANSNALATDNAGNVYFTGSFGSTVVFDGAGGSDSQTNTSIDPDSYLTKYNANGSYGWTKTFDTSSGGATGLGVATDSSGNPYVTGNFTDTVVFDGVGGTDSQTVGSNSDLFLTKYSPSGSYVYTKTFDTVSGGASLSVGGIAIDSNNNAYVTGHFTATVTFDGVGGSDTQSDTGNNQNSFLTRFNADGTYGWTRTFDTTNGSAYAYNVAADNSGNIYIDGVFQNTVIFDGIGGSDSRDGSTGSSYLTGYSASGVYEWTKNFQTPAGGDNASVATDNSGNVYATGVFYGTVTFDGAGGNDSRTDGGGGGDGFLLSYSTGISSPPVVTPTPPGAPNTGIGLASVGYRDSLGLSLLAGGLLIVSIIWYRKQTSGIKNH